MTSSKGEVSLGLTPSDMRAYRILDLKSFTSESANPFSQKISQGAQYASIDAWGEQLADTWSGGLGRLRTSESGFLYATVDSRTDNQLILSGALGAAHTWAADSTAGRGMFLPQEAGAFSTFALTTGNSIAVRIIAGEGYVFAINDVHLLAKAATGVVTTCSLYTDGLSTINLFDHAGNQIVDHSGNLIITGYMQSPVTLIASTTVTSAEERPIDTWLHFQPTWSLTVDTVYWLVFTSTAATVQCGTTWTGTTETYTGTWNVVSASPFFLTNLWAKTTGAQGLYSFSRTAADLYALIENGTTVPTHKIQLGIYDPDNDYFAFMVGSTAKTGDYTVADGATYDVDATFTISGADTDIVIDGTGKIVISELVTELAVTDDVTFCHARAVLYDGYMYIGLGSTYVKVNPGAGTASVVSSGASVMHAAQGYIWRADDNNLYYSADGATWSSAIKLGSDDFVIRGLATLARAVYAANDEGLYLVGDGDLVMGVTPWGSWTNDDIRMLEHEGALYIPVNGRILRYSADGSLMDIWISRDDDLPLAALGSPNILGSLNHYILAAVNPTTGPSSVWAFRSEGWHHVATIPAGCTVDCIYYDRALSRLWFGTHGSFAFYIIVDDSAINPYTSANTIYMPTGWLETCRQYGELVKLDKDWHSVFITGEFPTGTQADVYYASDENEAWTLLGSVTTDNTELIWPYATRPSGKWIRLGFALSTTVPLNSPRIQATVVKFLPMVNDRLRYHTQIVVIERQRMLDHKLNEYTAAQMSAHLMSLIKSVKPIYLEKPDGTQVIVKVEGFGESISELTQRRSGTRRLGLLYSLTLVEI